MSINKLIIVIGAYGSGKSEYSINLAKQMKMMGKEKISLVDLDVVNPYFRSREVRDLFAKESVEVVAPDSQFDKADLPMISPRVKGVINDLSKTVILDVGGDPAGCRALGRFIDDINQRPYEMVFVVNTKRPFTSDFKGIVEMKTMLENISKLKITEIVCNTNLMEFTDLEMISEGIVIIKEVAEKEGILFRTYLTMDDKENKYPAEIDGVKKMDLEYFLAKPWEILSVSPTLPPSLQGGIKRE